MERHQINQKEADILLVIKISAFDKDFCISFLKLKCIVPFSDIVGDPLPKLHSESELLRQYQGMIDSIPPHPPPPILEHFCPLFVRIGQMRSHFSQTGSHFAENTTPNPCSLLKRHTPLSRICTYIKHPNPSVTHPKTPLFLA